MNRVEPKTQDSRTLRTREAIVRAAEQLFARHGIEGVSLNTITRAAKQSNRNAIQYHFGSKTGLLQAIFDKHGPVVAERRSQLVDELAASGLPSETVIASALVIPLAEKLADSDGGEAFVHISAELIASNTLGYWLPERHSLQLTREQRIAEITAQLSLPQPVLEQRILLMNVLAYHGISDHARVRTNPDYRGLVSDTEFMVSNLIDSIAALLAAPPSAQTLALAQRGAAASGDSDD